MLSVPRLQAGVPWLVVALLVLGSAGLGPTGRLLANGLKEGGPSTAASPTAMVVVPTREEGPPIEERVPEPVPGVPPADEAAPGPHVRPRPDRRDYDNPVKINEETGRVEIVASGGDDGASSSSDKKAPTVPRLDESVLRWLPEIQAASKEWDVPAELIAGMMRLESSGEPGVISPVGARGLMQIMPDQLAGQGLPEVLWHDPATNVMAGGRELSERTAEWGSLEVAVQSYFGFGCDIYGTCTDVYVRVAFGWADYYRPIIADPTAFGLQVLPADWSFGPIVLYQVPAPPPPEEPPTPPTPVPDDATATPTREPTAPGEPTRPDETPVPTDVPDEPPTATQTSTSVPTETPTPAPTETPTQTPTPPEESVSEESVDEDD